MRNENEKDSGHLVGKASDEVKGEVKLSSQVLSRYAGNYQAQEPKMKGTITVAGGQLMFSIGGKGAVPLTTLSETGFYFPGGFPMEFEGRKRIGDSFPAPHPLRRFQIRPQRSREPLIARLAAKNEPVDQTRLELEWI